MKFSKPLFSIIFLISLLNTNFAQQNSTTNADICTPEYSQTLVKQQLSNSDSLTDSEKKIKILLKVAEFFWKADKEQSLDYYKEAFGLAEKDFDEKTADKIENSYFTDYRTVVLKEVAKKDTELAKQFKDKILKNLEEKIKNRNKSDFNKTREVRGILNVVAEIAESNPELAVQIGREVTGYELSNTWYFSLYSIAGNNRAVADQLFQEVLVKHSNTEVFRLLYLSAYPFAKDRIFGIEKNSLGTGVPKNFQPNPNLQALFLNTLFNRILQLTPTNTEKAIQTAFPETSVAISALEEIQPYMGQFPALLNKFNQAKTHASSLVSNEMLDSLKQRQETNEKFNLPFETKIKNLEKLESDGKLRDIDIASLIFGFDEEKYFEKMEIWLVKISDQKVSEEVKQYFYYKRSKVAIDEKRFDDALKYAEKVTEFIFKANQFLAIAQGQLKEKSDDFAANTLLTKVYTNANKAENSVEKAQVFFGLARIYADYDLFQSFQSLSKAIEITNSLEDPDIFKNDLQLKVEIPKQGGFYTVYNTVGLNMEEVFVRLSKKDFGQTLGQAESFADPYFRTIAVISSINECQKNQKKPVVKKAGN
ncbi:MAG: hypothetical protein ACR2MD_07130 [Aridibacter sp.]